ncbi:MAG: NADH-quinone oxidoreductase subunit H, partial [Propionibacterium sp.]|nr:NADH-quinone oxidoreductase subunit H [Propionibacterium sp.]
AQLISYELAMGLSLVAVFMYAGTMSTSQIVEAQAQPISLFGATVSLPSWYGLLLLPSFVIYYISMFGETNRQPFDMPECESELVSGHITDYSGFRYALFFLAEYINVATVSAVSVTLFLGGYNAPWPLNGTFLDQGWWGLLWFILKVQIMIFTVAWVRAAVPRVRYDQMMRLGWKVLIPANLAWIVMLALMRGASLHGWWANPIFIGTLIVVLAAIVIVVWRSEPAPIQGPEPIDLDAEFDAFAGGYPVPPMPGQKLIGMVVAEGIAEPETASASSGQRATSNGAEL